MKKEAVAESTHVLQKEYEELVIARIRKRREIGRAEHGATLARTDLSTLAWINHAQEEALDFALYLERLRDELSDHSGFLAFMAGALAEFPCCHEEGAHDGTPPMMWPELIACIVRRAVTDASKAGRADSVVRAPEEQPTPPGNPNS